MDTVKKEKSMVKKRMLLTCVVIGCLISGLAVNAETKSYNFYLLEGQCDFLSPAVKAGGSSWENKYYVTQSGEVGAPSGQSPRTRYYSCLSGSVVSKPLNLLWSDQKGHWENYNITASAGKTYELYAECVTGTGSDVLVFGKWTP